MGRDDLIDCIKKVKQYNFPSFGETQAKGSIIEPILHRLGWDTEDPSEVVREYSTPSGDRIDYALLKRSGPLVFVEAKKPGESLDNRQYIEQMMRYAFQVGVPLAVLSNGIEWWFYLPMEKVEWEMRKFYSVDLNTQPVESVCEKLMEFLSKENVISGSAVEHAKEKRISTEKQLRIQKALPEVWKAIVAQPHQQLIDLLTDETERNCGYKPDESTVRTFIEKLTYTGAPERGSKEKEGRSPKFTGTEGGGKTRISRIGHKSIDDRTFELVKDNPHRYSEEEISQIICEERPDKNRDTLRNTTHRRLTGHLNRTKGVRIEKDASGKYYIE
jgi:hypothetical protein